MSGCIAERVMPVLEQNAMQPDVKAAFILAKQAISRTGGVGLPTFRNDRGNLPGEGAPLPVLSLGCKYLKFQVGAAHPGDPRINRPTQADFRSASAQRAHPQNVLLGDALHERNMLHDPDSIVSPAK